MPKNQLTSQEALAILKNEENFSKFNNLKREKREAMVEKTMTLMKDWGYFNKENTPEQITQKLKDEGLLFNPVVRLGIAMAAMPEAYPKSPQIDLGIDKKTAAKIEQSINKQVFTDTLTPTSKSNEQKVTGMENGRDMVERNKLAQKAVMKMAFLAQLGNTTLKEKNTGNTGSTVPLYETDKNISDLFAAGGRTGFILPHSTSEVERIITIDSIYGMNEGSLAGNKKRLSATHNVLLPEVGTDTTKSWKEVKTRATLVNQYGMDLAVGGLGNKGVNEKPLLNDGSCGHLYSHIRLGDDKRHGMLLVGFESGSPDCKEGNQLGHKHTWLAKESKATCFGSQKVCRIGDKLGGRTVDLSGINAKDLHEALKQFDKVIDKVQKSPDSDFSKAFIDKLTGKAMGPNELSNFLRQDLNLDVEKSNKLVTGGKNVPLQNLENQKPVKSTTNEKRKEPENVDKFMKETLKGSKALPAIPDKKDATKGAKSLPKIPDKKIPDKKNNTKEVPKAPKPLPTIPTAGKGKGG
jgi:hypothetical protein